MKHKVYEELLSILKLQEKHQNNLSDRGFTNLQITKLNYKSLSCDGITPHKMHSLEKVIAKKNSTLKGIPGFYQPKGNKNPEIVKPFVSGKKPKKDEEQKTYPCDAITIPVRDRWGDIQAIKLRLDTKIAQRKYKYLSSKGYPGGTANDPLIHYPLGWNETLTTIRVTEGEIKADYATLHTSVYTVSIPGVNFWRLFLEEIITLPNIEKIILCPDADKSSKVDPYTGKKVKRGQYNAVARSFACLAYELINNGYAVVMEDWDESLGKGIDDLIKEGNHPRTMTVDELNGFIDSHGKPDFPHVIETSSGYIRVLPTKENTKALLNFLGVDYAYNLMKHNKEVTGRSKNAYYPTNINNSINAIRSRASIYGMPVAQIAETIDLVASDNAYHPAKRWLEEDIWDGITRIEELFNTLTVPEEWEKAKLIYLKRWTISTIAALYRGRGFWTKVCLVLSGAGSIGKTTWFEKLFGDIALEAFKDGVILDPSNKDSRFNVISHWCVELGELGATFRKRDREELKAFITERGDLFRAPYSREQIYFPRQCVFVGSVDQKEFLMDEAGDIRFACLPVTDINLDHTVDMQQFWREVRDTWYLAGESWFFNKEELEMLKEHNTEFKEADPLDEILLSAYSLVVGDDPYRWLTSSQIADELYTLEYLPSSPTLALARKLSKSASRVFSIKDQKGSKRPKEFAVSPIREKGGPDLKMINGGKEQLSKTDEQVNKIKPETI